MAAGVPVATARICTLSVRRGSRTGSAVLPSLLERGVVLEAVVRGCSDVVRTALDDQRPEIPRLSSIRRGSPVPGLGGYGNPSAQLGEQLTEPFKSRFGGVVVAQDAEVVKQVVLGAVGVAQGEQLPVGDVELVSAGVHGADD